MERTLFTEEHEQFRAAVRTFVEREVTPHIDEWETAGVVSNDVWKRAGEAGFLGMAAPEEPGRWRSVKGSPSGTPATPARTSSRASCRGPAGRRSA